MVDAIKSSKIFSLCSVFKLSFRPNANFFGEWPYNNGVEFTVDAAENRFSDQL